MKANQASADSHTDFEQSTLTYALLKDINEPLAEDYKERAFPHSQAKENSETILASLPKDFFPNLITNSLPKTNHPSLIHNFGKFTLHNVSRRSQLIFKRLSRIQLTHRIVGHTRTARALAIDPYNALFFTGSDDTNIKCWHVPSLSLMCTMKGHEDAVCGLKISPDRKLLASFAGKEDKFVRLWSLVDGAAVAIFRNDEGGHITAIEFSPCNRFLAIASSSGIVRFFHITGLIPVLAKAKKEITADGYRSSRLDDILFSDGDFSKFNDVNPQDFIASPPRSQKQLSQKMMATYVTFSPGGNLALVSYENGSFTIASMISNKKWSAQAHEAPADGGMFLKNSFHTILTWSCKGGEIKIWSFNDKLKAIQTFTVRVNNRRSHLVNCSVSCDESLLFACTSQSIFAWRIDNATPLRHNDDNTLLAGCVGIEAHPFLPTIFMAITKSHITFWDATNPSPEPLHTLIIPVETPRINMAQWSPDGLSVIATDAGGNSGGGVFVFRISEEPECRTTPQFFNSDFAASEWIDGVGQIEDSTRTPTHLQDKSILIDSERVNVYTAYKPIRLDEKSVAVTPIFTPSLKYAWLNEEIWLNNKIDRGNSNPNLNQALYNQYSSLNDQKVKNKANKGQKFQGYGNEVEQFESYSDGPDSDSDSPLPNLVDSSGAE